MIKDIPAASELKERQRPIGSSCMISKAVLGIRKSHPRSTTRTFYFLPEMKANSTATWANSVETPSFTPTKVEKAIWRGPRGTRRSAITPPTAANSTSSRSTTRRGASLTYGNSSASTGLPRTCRTRTETFVTRSASNSSPWTARLRSMTSARSISKRCMSEWWETRLQSTRRRNHNDNADDLPQSKAVNEYALHVADGV